MAKKEKDDEIVEYIFRPYITKNGIRIYPKNSKFLKIPIKKK